ncbi:radical SAM protein [Glycomyces luteolus]|uniref:Radical SAM protein n=1 Tax=Glycomyces luteolus TaxID=2670330 RepID=A0A9X3T4D2_9ACTN|nr:radical SAM protein [Glycomyces luteolus]MDA1360910.1 radical SAM protein [Glycomyces luteolus]
MQLFLDRYIHLIERQGQHLAFNSVSLDSWELTSAEARVLKEHADGATAVDTVGVDVEALVEEGLLVSVRTEPGKAMERLMESRKSKSAKGRGHFNSLRMSLTERCNMACTYCFQQALYPEDQPRMSEETMAQTLEWFIDQAEGDSISLQYFGGEPLLEWPLIQLANATVAKALAEGRISGYRQTMTTNGTVLTDTRAKWLLEQQFELIFSFDGPPEINDQMRIFKSGRGSYEKAAEGIKRWSALGGEPAILMTATQLNLRSLPRYVRWFAEESGINPAVIALNSPQPTETGWETGGVELAQAVFEMWLYCDERGIAFQAPGTFIPLHLRTKMPQSDHCIDGNLFGTEAGTWPVYVSADGRRSLCLVHHNDHRVEVPKGGDPIELGRRWHFEGPTVEECDGCIASQICGGPCTLEKLLWGGDKLSADRCDFMRTMTTEVLTSGRGE